MVYLLYCFILIRLAYWFFIFTKLARYKTERTINRTEGVSIVVCVKNNLEGLKLLFTKLLKQNHEAYEIIVVDDFSTDILEDFVISINSPLVLYCKPDVDVPGKKIALTKGISLSKYEWILVTDSDCIPSSLDWVSIMIGKAIHEQKEIVLGYGPLEGKGLIGKLAKYEAAYVAMQYFSYALAGKPYMGVGRNMLYRKSLFLNIDPFADNYHIPSGDDDLFVQKGATASNTTICLDINAQCKSQSAKDLKGFINQKVRHASTSSFYNKDIKLFLGVFASVHILFYLFTFYSIVFGLIGMNTAISAWLFMCAMMMIIQYACFVKLNEQKQILNLFVSDILLSLLYTIVGYISMSNKKKGWN